jgi:hypothetical protein
MARGFRCECRLLRSLLSIQVLWRFCSSGNGSRAQSRLPQVCGLHDDLHDRGLVYTSGVLWRGPSVLNISVSLSAQFEGIQQWRRSYVRHKSSRHVEYNIVSMGNIFFTSRIGVSDLVPLLKMPTIFENSLFSAWSLGSLISPVKSPVSRTASRHLGEANGDA